ncbi:hypothetical protein D9615_010417 [Tricholomella constricta]|uniref:CCHC-type domain-containing protein n=1 Tax=Tricholomella constricta TaxID=117010 RepID=A0A8H5GQB0_9AGAR|nr:hypothetical protein D9615_010417 [Tricholomella constricta]
MNMAARTDDWTFLEKFLKTLPREMRKALFDDGLSPEINTVQEFLAVGLAHQATQKTADYFERNITAQRNQPSQPRKPDGGRVNTPQNNFNRTRRVFGALNEKPYAKLAYQDQPGRGEQKLHVEKPAMKTGDRPRYDQPKNHDHHNHPPGEVCFNCGKLGHFAKDCKQPKKQRAFLRAARTAAPDAASEADDEDTSPEDPDGRDNGRPDTEADNEDEGDEFVDVRATFRAELSRTGKGESKVILMYCNEVNKAYLAKGNPKRIV